MPLLPRRPLITAFIALAVFGMASTNALAATGMSSDNPATYLTLTATGTEIMRLTATSVGIGTTTLSQKLTVNGNVALSAATNAYYMGSSKVLFHPNGDSSSLAVGMNALVNQTTSLRNTAVGGNAMYSNWSGYENVAVGASALYYNSDGYGNTAVGRSALQNNVSGHYATAVGDWALFAATGNFNTAIGYSAGSTVSSGTSNTLIGHNAGLKISTGSANVILGPYVGATTLTTGSNNILIGNGSAVDTPAAGTNNHLNIGGTIYGDLATGNVGIGSTVPNAKLDVVGTAYLSKLMTTGNNVASAADPNAADVVIGSTAGTRHDSSILYWSNTSAVRQLATGNTFQYSVWASLTPDAQIGTAGENSYFNASIGNVGIGTATPGAKLDVNGTAKISGTVTISTNNITAITDRLYLWGNNSGATGSITMGSPTYAGGSGITFYYTPGYSSIQASVDTWAAQPLVFNPSGGNVGIGTTGPSQKLEVRGTVVVGAGGVGLIGDAWNAGSGYVFTTMGSSYFNGTNWITPAVGSNFVSTIATTAANGIVFYLAPSTGNTQRTDSTATFLAYEAMRITSDRNVGIGTATPDGKLHVLSTITATSGWHYGLNVWTTFDPAAASSAYSMNYLGIGTDASKATDLTSAYLYGVYGAAWHEGSGTLGRAYGTRGGVTKAGTGPVTIARAIEANIDNTNASGAITNAYGVYVSPFDRTGPITNSWGVYVADTVANNYFAGNVGIGTTTIPEKLTVNGNVAVSAITNAYYLAGNKILWQPASDTYSLAIGNGALAAQSANNKMNTAVGYMALNKNTTATYNSAFGAYALQDNTTGNYNTGLGGAALYKNTTGNNNTAVGISALSNNTTGSGNAGLGMYALDKNSQGNSNTAIGTYSLYYATSSNNTSVGYYSGFKVSTGTNNTILGYSVGSTTLTTGSNNILIGTSSLVDTPAVDTSNWLNIGNLVYGDMAAGKIGVGSSTINATLDVNGYAKLKINAAAPVACSATYKGSIAYTGTTTNYLCFCDGTSWKQAHSPATACTW